MFEHFEKRQRRDVDLFRCVWLIGGLGVSLVSAHSAEPCKPTESSHVKHFQKLFKYYKDLQLLKIEHQQEFKKLLLAQISLKVAQILCNPLNQKKSLTSYLLWYKYIIL